MTLFVAVRKQKSKLNTVHVCREEEVELEDQFLFRVESERDYGVG